MTFGGNDTVHWATGDGDDSIYASNTTDTGIKTLVLDDLNPSDVVFSFQGASLLLTVKATGEVIRVADQFLHAENLLTTPSTDNYGLDLIQFANGVTLNRAGINQRTGSDFVGLSFHNVDPNAVTISLPSMSNSSSGGSGHSPSTSSGVSIQINYGSQTDEFGNVYALDVWGLSDPSIRNLYGSTTLAPVLQGPALLDGVKMAFSVFASGSQVATSGDLASLIEQLNIQSNPLVNDDHNYNYSPVGTVDFPPANNRGGIILSLYSDFDVALNFLGTNVRDVFLGSRIVDGGGQLDDVVFAADGDDALYGYEGDDILAGGKGNDIIDGGDGVDLISGGAGSDLLYAGKGNDAIHGGDGSDYIFGDKGNDVLVGGHGDDVLQGGEGNDTYIYRLGDGNDRIQDAELLTSAEFEILKLADTVSTGVEFTRIGNDLLIRILATSETITVVNQLSSQHFAIEQIQFSDGINFNAADIAARLVVNGTSGRDIITGTTSSETINGGLGDDFLVGNSGSDTFVYHSGDGDDEIKELFTTPNTDVDTLKLADLNQSQIEISRVGNDMLLTTLATGERVKIVNQFGTDTNIIEKLEFANGTVWLSANFLNHLTLRGTNVADTLFGSSSGETIVGNSGNDSLTGGGGSDIYLYNRGDGADTIIENSADQFNGVDRLKLADISSNEVELVKTGTNDLLVKIAGTSQTILLVAQTYQYNSVIEEIEFANGSVWNSATIRYWMNEGSRYYGGTNMNDTLIGSYLDQTLEGGMGNDIIDGKAGVDYLYGGTGNDTLIISAAENGIYDRLDGGDGTDILSLDTLGFAVDVDLVTNNGEVRTGWTATLPAGGMSLIATVTGLEKIYATAFDDAIRADANANTINAGSGNDYIDGRSGNDTLSGGAGNDTIYGNTGDDTVDGGNGADYLDGGLGYDTLTYANSSSAITINLATGAAGGGDATGDTVFGFEYVTGTAFDDTFTGNSGSNSFLAGNGNDIFYVSGGVDNFYGGAGTDVASFAGFGFAVWVDLLDTSMEVYHRSGSNVAAGSWQTLVNLSEVENVIGTSFDDEMYGNTWANMFIGGAGNDKLSGAAGMDILNGGLGNDSLTGGTEADRYAYSSGIFGNDIINGFQDGLDKIDLTGSGLTFSSFTASQIGSDTILSYFDGTNTSTIKLAGMAIASIDANDFIV